MDQKQLCMLNTFAQLQCVCLRFACWPGSSAEETPVVCLASGSGRRRRAAQSWLTAAVGKRMCAHLLAARGLYNKRQSIYRCYEWPCLAPAPCLTPTPAPLQLCSWDACAVCFRGNFASMDIDWGLHPQIAMRCMSLPVHWQQNARHSQTLVNNVVPRPFSPLSLDPSDLSNWQNWIPRAPKKINFTFFQLTSTQCSSRKSILTPSWSPKRYLLIKLITAKKLALNF